MNVSIWTDCNRTTRKSKKLIWSHKLEVVPRVGDQITLFKGRPTETVKSLEWVLCDKLVNITLATLDPDDEYQRVNPMD